MFRFYNAYEFKLVKRIRFVKKLLISLISKSGRSSSGLLVLRGRGNCYKRYYRLIDFKRLLCDVPAKILRFEYDPNRMIYIMLVLYLNGVLSYFLAPNLVRVNKFLMNGLFAFPLSGNGSFIFNCSVGSFVNCVKIGNFIGKYARAAGTYIQIIRKIGSYILLRLPSKEERFVPAEGICVLGRLSNKNFKLVKLSSAGFFRRKGFRPIVRGVAKNPIDHPHGGGEGRTTSGRPSVSPWGIYTKGVRTTSRFMRFNLYKFGFFRRRDKTNW